MPRPRLGEEARDRRLVVRCTASEEARVKSAAAAAGMKQSDYLRSRVFLTPARLLERTEPQQATAGGANPGRTDDRPAPVAAAPGGPPSPAEVPAELHRCPRFEGCGFEAPSPNARCPVHGRAVLP